MTRGPNPGRTRALRILHAAQILVGAAVGLAAMRRPGEAVIAAAIAAILITLAVGRALREDQP